MSIDASHSELRTISSRPGAASRMRRRLLDEGLRVRVDLVFLQTRAGRRLARRVADHGGEVAEDQHRDVAEVLEQPQPPEHDREAEVEVGGGRVDAELDPQRPLGGQLLAQLVRGDDVDRARGEQLHLAVDVHGGRR